MRDTLALGSWVFYLLVIIRATIGPFRPFLDQLIIAGALVLAINFFWKNLEDNISRAIPLAVFTSLFYKDTNFSIFAGAITLLLISSSYSIEKEKIKIAISIAIGSLAAFAGYYIPLIYI